MLYQLTIDVNVLENKRMKDMLFLDKRVISGGIAILVSLTLNTYL